MPAQLFSIPSSRSAHRQQAGSVLGAVLSSCRSAFVAVGLMSGMINVLALTGSFFMLEVYDRVLPSHSIATLVGLAVLVTGLYIFQGVLDLIRGRLLVRIGATLDHDLSALVYNALVKLPLRKGGGDGLRPLRDLDQVRGFLSSIGPAAFFDLPWMPLYLGICFAFHPWIGLAATAGGVMLITVALLTETFTREPVKAAAEWAVQRMSIADAGRRNAEALAAMGMAGRLTGLWAVPNTKYMTSQQRAADVAGGLGALSKVLRMLLQSAVLGLGAYLVINQQATAGIIIASSILTSRALAPVELSIANWKGFMAARQSWRRLKELLNMLPAEAEPMALPSPSKVLSVENVGVLPPGTAKLVVQDISFRLEAGNGLGIIGPSASGKSSLARIIVGAWTPLRGKVRLDGAALEHWSSESLGRHIGYLPQDVELFAGTVGQNIARFEPTPDPKEVIEAAQGAGVHELILRLPDGYETQIGEGGQALSAGQRQRIGLARALYGSPFLVVLDEPNSNLDAEGEDALTRAILSVRARGGIAVVIAHRQNVLSAVDHMLVMAEGKARSFGPKDEVLGKLGNRVARPAVLRASATLATSGPLAAVGQYQGRA